MAIDDFMNTMDAFAQNEQLKPITDFITQIMELDDNALNEQSVDIIQGTVNGAFTPAMRKTITENMLKEFDEQGLTRANALENLNIFNTEVASLIEALKPSQYKKMILDGVFDIFSEIFEEAIEQYHNYAIKLPIKLDEGAKMPTYAHDTDSAADLYAQEDTTIPAHSLSNMVKTGVHIALPEGWTAIVVPRSSIGMKTGLRLSNSQGVIDQDYRGPIGVIYDNHSDSDYEIKQGDRIAQLYIMPTYRFKGVQVDGLDDTERGSGGFGSSGK